MSLSSRFRQIVARPHLRLIALVGVIVPRRLRADWRQEWEAELQHREELLADWDRLDWRTKLQLLRRSTSAFRDALWLQTYRWEDAMIQDLRFGVRMLARNRTFTAVAILSLALGIGANIAIFQLLDAVRLRTLPIKAPHELAEVRLANMDGARGGFNRSPYPAVTNPIWEQIRDRQEAFSGIFAWGTDSVNLAPGGEVRPPRLLYGSGNFFETLGVRPALGRLFTAGDDQRGCCLLCAGARLERLSRCTGSDPVTSVAEGNGCSGQPGPQRNQSCDHG